MMFYRARIRLTLWYVAVLAVILVLFEVAIASMLQRNLQASVASDLQGKAAQAAAAVLDVEGGAPYFEREALTSDPTWSEVELYAATPTGSALQTVNQVTGSVLPDRAGLMAAFAGQSQLGTIGSGSHAFMVFTRPVRQHANGNVVAVVQVARSLRPVTDAMQRLVELLAAASLVALLCAFAAGFWLAGKSLEPIRLSVVRQRAFVGDASHELRTPVTVIRTAAEAILRHREATDRSRALARDIVGETEQLARIVDDLGVLAQADARRLHIRRDPVDVAELLREVAASGALLSSSKGEALVSDIDSATGVVVGDASRLRQALLVLIDNAVKFSAAGKRVTLRAETSGDELRVHVVDEGVGIAPAELPRIFERFFRGEAARQQEGSGLGLAIAQLIVEQHSGRISVRSQVGKGSEFEVRIPLRAASAEDAGVRMTAAQKLQRRAEVVK